MRQIYALVDPRTNLIRYVGCSAYPERRLRQHLNRYKPDTNPKIKEWVAELKEIDLEPSLMLLGDVPMHARWQRLERFWIAELLDTGHPLLNSKRGGEGTDSDMAKATWAKPDAEFNRLVALSDPEVRAKMSAAQKEINSRPGVREHKSVASKKANSTPEKKKLFAAQSSERLKNNEEHVRAMRAGNKALWSDPKRKEQIVGKMRSAVQEAWSDPIKSAQRRAKIAAAWAAKRAATTT